MSYTTENILSLNVIAITKEITANFMSLYVNFLGILMYMTSFRPGRILTIHKSSYTLLVGLNEWKYLFALT